MTNIKLILGICGASGVQYGIELIKILKEKKIEVHLIISDWAKEVIRQETNITEYEVNNQADYSYGYYQMDAAIASSSFIVDGMVICPVTVSTISKIASGQTDNLIARSADNMLKLRNPLILAFRETPLSPACLKNLYSLASYGAIVLPLAPGFYHTPKSIDDMVSFMVGKILDALNIPNQEYKRWK